MSTKKTTAPAPPARPNDSVDLIHVQLEEHRQVAEMLGAIFQLCEDVTGNGASAPICGLWGGMTVVARRLADDCLGTSGDVTQLFEQMSSPAAVAGGAR